MLFTTIYSRLCICQMADSVTNQLIIGRFVHSFFVSLFFCPLSLFHLYFFSSLFSLICLHHPTIYPDPSIHSFRPSLCPRPTHAHTYPQFIIYHFCIHKNEFLGSSIGLFSHACLLACLLAYTQLSILPWSRVMWSNTVR